MSSEPVVRAAFGRSEWGSNNSLTSLRDGAGARPTEEVLRRSAEIGIKEHAYFWITEQSLQAPLKLPKGWFEAKSDEGHTYYFNDDTGVSVWTHPALEPYKQLYANAKRKAQATTAAASSSSSNNYNNISSSASIGSATAAAPLSHARDRDGGVSESKQRGGGGGGGGGPLHQSRQQAKDVRDSGSPVYSRAASEALAQGPSVGNGRDRDRGRGRGRDMDRDRDRDRDWDEEDDDDDDDYDDDDDRNSRDRSDYWYSQLEAAKLEKNRLDGHNKRLEDMLQRAVAEQVRRHIDD